MSSPTAKKTPSGRELRTFRTYWVQPKMQLKMSALMSFGFLLIGLLLIILIFKTDDVIQDLNASMQLDSQTAYLLTNKIYFYLHTAIAFSIFFAVSAFIIGAILSHRIYGPMVPIKAHIRRLIAGDFSSRVRIRTEDEFKDLADELNFLAENLEKQKPS